MTIVLTASCGSNEKKPMFKTDSKGNRVPIDSYVCVAVDETFKPVFEFLFADFRERNVEAFVDPLYMSEDEAIKLLMADSVRSIVVTRPMTDNEKAILKDKYSLVPMEKVVAFDAITLITNKANPDTLITKDEVKQIVQGKITNWSQLANSHGQSGEIEIVFDNNGSSTVRYMRDSLCAGKNLQGKLKAAKTYDELISYVSRNRNAIGVIGVDWVGDKKDSTKLSFLTNVNIMSVGVKKTTNPSDYYKPFQFYIASGSYPMPRWIYIITTEPRSRSAEKNFFYYLTDAPNHNNMGQMIINKKSQLLPYAAVHSRNVVITRY